MILIVLAICFAGFQSIFIYLLNLKMRETELSFQLIHLSQMPTKARAGLGENFWKNLMWVVGAPNAAVFSGGLVESWRRSRAVGTWAGAPIWDVSMNAGTQWLENSSFASSGLHQQEAIKWEQKQDSNPDSDIGGGDSKWCINYHVNPYSLLYLKCRFFEGNDNSIFTCSFHYKTFLLTWKQTGNWI